MIIEFTGLPGSGKSTLNTAAEEFLRSRGYHVWTPRNYWQILGLRERATSPQRILSVTRKAAALLKPALVNFQLIRVIPWLEVLKGRPFLHQKMVVNSFLSNLAELEAAKRVVSNGAVALLDEGIVHRAYGLFVLPQKSINSRAVKDYGRIVDLPDLLVYIRLKRAVSLNRMLDRGVPLRMVGLKNAESLRMLGNGEVLLDTLINSIRKRVSPECHVLDLDGEVMHSAKQNLMNWLEDHLPTPKPDFRLKV